MIPGNEAIIVCNHFFVGTPAGYVCREEGELQVLCGGVSHAGTTGQLLCWDSVRQRDPSLSVCEALEEGQQATRVAPGQPWVIDALQE